MINFKNQKLWLLLSVFALVIYSNEMAQAEEHAGEHEAHTEHAEEAGHHEHAAPHGGTLIVFGEEFAHLELVLDAVTGSLSGYVLDGGAEYAVRIEQASIELGIDKDGQKSMVSLGAQANALTGESPGDTSEFHGQSDFLTRVDHFKGVITSVEIKGQTFDQVGFDFPEGNEHEEE